MIVMAMLDHLIIILYSDNGVTVRTEFGEIESFRTGKQIRKTEMDIAFKPA